MHGNTEINSHAKGLFFVNIGADSLKTYVEFQYQKMAMIGDDK